MRKFKGFTLIELMIVVAIIGILAALAIPNFMKFQARSKQSEAKSNLKSVFTAEKSYYAEHDTYSPFPADIGFAPERGNRYAYFTGSSKTLTPRDDASDKTAKTDDGIAVDTLKYGPAAAVTTLLTLAGGSTITYTSASLPATEFSASAAGNIDTETTGLDGWQISSESSSSASATCGNSETVTVAGTPYNVNNDVSCDTALP